MGWEQRERLRKKRPSRSRSHEAQSAEGTPGFLFVANHLALDFLNTCPIQDGKAIELLPDFNALLRWYRAAHVLNERQEGKLRKQWGKSPRAKHFVQLMREWREKLRHAVLAWERDAAVPQSTVEELNRLMAEHPMRSRLIRRARALLTEWWFEASEPEDLIAPLAHSATMLFANVDRTRVRQCGNCVLHFYDTSKKGTRHWCSMQICGNRFKVAAYAARKRLRGRKRSRAVGSVSV
jgi:predicted RNA-binding Zn ribbon-like protein